jgi:V-type H+-transporting ATPase subunit a
MLQARIEKTENDILELSQNAVNLKSNYLELMELRHVLEKTQVFFTEVANCSSAAFYLVSIPFV